ncbi:MAG: hypothetical protein ACYC3I_22500 [Gemmataceae bacterium]
MKVYNWEIEDYHTYFVSASADGASIWAHNASCSELETKGGLTTLKILNKFKAGSAAARQLQRFVKAWNKEIAAAGGSMTTRTLTSAEELASKAWRRAMGARFPKRFAGKVVGHVPDAGAGGVASGGRAMALLDSVNSYLGGLLNGVPVGTNYNAVRLFR